MALDTQMPSTKPGAGPNQAAGAISVEGVGLVFPNGYVGLKETSLDIREGEFCTLLGASGSGKTTLLRVMAGLIAPTTGRVRMNGRDVTDVAIQNRNIGFVFQNYALFPHMTVAENIAYPLKVHKWQPDMREARVREVLDLIELPHVADRQVGELSGGQQQRVAIGRALAYRPALLLLDEPMGALDRRLRQQLGAQLREIQQSTGVTAVYVTHDQEEAFILSDRIAIMERGEILQYEQPKTLYHTPRSRFVATFLGEANVVDIAATGDGISRSALGNLQIRGGTASAAHLVIRPEDIVLQTDASSRPDHVTPIPVRIESELFLGSRCLLTLAAPNGVTVIAECLLRDVPPQGGDVWMTWRIDSAIPVER